MPAILDTIVQIIILISALLVAIKTIYGFIKRPKQIVDNFVEVNKEELFEDMKGFVSQEINGLKESLENEWGEIRITFENEMNSFKQFTCQENEKLRDELGIDKETLKIMIRHTIECIYEQGVEKKALTQQDRLHMHELYKMYVGYDGNGYITNLVNQMNNWDTI